MPQCTWEAKEWTLLSQVGIPMVAESVVQTDLLAALMGLILVLDVVCLYCALALEDLKGATACKFMDTSSVVYKQDASRRAGRA